MSTREQRALEVAHVAEPDPTPLYEELLRAARVWWYDGLIEARLVSAIEACFGIVLPERGEEKEKTDG